MIKQSDTQNKNGIYSKNLYLSLPDCLEKKENKLQNADN